MRISHETICSLIPILNQLVKEYQSKFGNVGFRSLPAKGKVSLVKKEDAPQRIQCVVNSSVGVYDDEVAQIYFIKENLAKELEETSENIRGQLNMDFGFGNIEKYVLAALLCHEGIIHRSTKTIWLEDDVLEFYNNLQWFLLKDEGIENNYGFIMEGRSRIKSRGLRLRFLEEGSGDVKMDSTAKLDELVIHSLTGRILGLQVMKSNPDLKYYQAQLPYVLVGGRIFDEKLIADVAEMFEKNKKPTFNFTRDYFVDGIPNRVQRLASEYFKDPNKQELLTDVFITQIYGIPEKLNEIYEKVYQRAQVS